MRRVLGEAGFTLVETVLSLVVLGVALVPLVNLFAQAAERSHLDYEVVAPGLAAQKMEELIRNRAIQGWASFTATPTSYTTVDTTNFPTYQWMVAVDTVSQSNFNTVVSAGSTPYKRITVFVKKPDNTELKLTTIVTNY